MPSKAKNRPNPKSAADSLAPSRARAKFEAALALHRKGQLARAQALCQQALKVQPDHFDALHLLGVIAAETKNTGRAVELISKAIEINPNDAAAYYNRGNAFRDLRQHEAAIKSYDNAIALKPGYAEAYYNRGNALRNLGHYEAALQSYDKAIAFKPDYAEAYNNRGIALRNLRQQKAALQSFDKAVALKPDFVEAYNNRGNALDNLMQHEAALQSYDKAIAFRPDYAVAYNNRGNALRNLGQHEAALQSYDKAIALKPDYAEAHDNRGNALRNLGQHEAALQSYDKAIALKPDYAEAHYNRGNALRNLGQHEAALQSYDKAIALKPDYVEAYNNRGNALNNLKQHEAALQSYDKAIALRPDYVNAYSNRSIALRNLGKHEAALHSLDKAIVLKPDYAEAYNNRGIVLRNLRQWEAALKSYEKAITLKPDYAEAYNNHGNVLQQLKKYEVALQSYEKAIALKPDYAEAYNNRGIALRNLRQHVAALQDYDKAIALNPGYAEPLNNRGIALHDLKQHEAALQSYEKAITLKPDYVEAYNNSGNTFRDLMRFPEAIASYDKVLAISPDYPYVAGDRAYCGAHICDWRDRERIETQIIAGIRSGHVSTPPFTFLAISDNPGDQLNCARSHVEDKYPPISSTLEKTPHYQHDRIRVAYLSADFHDHATAYLIAGLLEQHDRASFEVIAISFGPGQSSEMRSRLANAVDRFIDARNISDAAVARLMRDGEVDIAVDLKGYTMDCRPGIFAYHAIPTQVNYLGYPGTMGAPYIDYVIADEFVIPRIEREYYAEKVVYLPDTYQVNDSKRKIGDYTPRRADVGLHEDGFVFCCFNNNYKLTPRMFDIWMRLLRRVDGSVLWLLKGSNLVVENLRREARLRGVEPDRLVFASRARIAEHLARHRLADLFLDTLPYNAHTTASDALWAGLPVLTCAGTTFAGRVAGSLLRAVDLPELITNTLEEYEALALKLATNEKLLRDMKGRLAQNRLTKPLFDTDRFRRHIEAAYTTMWEIHQRGEEPRSFKVPAVN